MYFHVSTTAPSPNVYKCTSINLQLIFKGQMEMNKHENMMIHHT